MARKQKNVYERIAEAENKILECEEMIRELRGTLITLNKEKDTLEMNKMFEHARENKLSFDDVIKALNIYTSGNKNK